MCVISMLVIGHEEKDIQRAEPQHKGEENTQFFKALFLYVYVLLLRSVKYRKRARFIRAVRGRRFRADTGQTALTLLARAASFFR